MKRHLFNNLPLMLAVFFCAVMVFCAAGDKKKLSPLKTDVDEQQLIADLEENIPMIMEKAMIPGLSIALIRDGEVFWANSYGVKNIDTAESVTVETIFEAASLSKPVFSYAVLKLVERGEVELDRPLVDYASDSYIENNFLGKKIDDERFRKITARMIMSHSPGFPNWRGQNPLLINFEPGEKFSYSGEGFGYLQKIVEKITGLDLNEFMHREVFEPLEMTHSSYVWQEQYDALASSPHDMMREAGEKRKPGTGHAAATLHTTAIDFAKFMTALMNFRDVQASTVDSLFSPQVIVNPEESDKIAWGLGFGLQHTRDGLSCWHWGDNMVFRCLFVAYPTSKIGVVYFTNSYYGLAVRKQITDLAIGGDNVIMDSDILNGYGDVDRPWMDFIRTAATEDVDAALERFAELKEHYAESDIIPENPMNDAGYAFMRKKKYSDAIKLFTLNVAIYPNSSNTYDSLGEAFMENGETQPAIENYLKSLELDPENENAKTMLERLGYTR